MLRGKMSPLQGESRVSKPVYVARVKIDPHSANYVHLQPSLAAVVHMQHPVSDLTHLPLYHPFC